MNSSKEIGREGGLVAPASAKWLGIVSTTLLLSSCLKQDFSIQLVPESTKAVCKLETASNFEPREKEGKTRFVADDSLCVKKTCPTSSEANSPFQVVRPEALAMGCKTLSSDKDYQVKIKWAADDASLMFLNGTKVAETSRWYDLHEKEFTLKGGCHTLAIQVVDTQQVVSGLLISIEINGQSVWKSGEGNAFARVTGPDYPSEDWKSLEYREIGWKKPEVCSDQSPWGTIQSGLQGQGAKWTWWSQDCKPMSQAFFRVSFALHQIKTELDPNECKSQK
jgi:hypothetical protein